MPQSDLGMDRRELQRHLRKRGLVATSNKATAPHLQAYGLRPDVVIDVGVDTGTRFLYDAFPDAQFVLVDPRAESRVAMTGSYAPKRASFHETALGAVDGQQVLNIPVDAAGALGARASLLEAVGAMAQKFTGIEHRTVAVTTLDHLAAAYPGRVGLKIDTEGAEADVLTGGVETLRRCDFVILEMSLSQRFKKTARPSQLIALLAQAGLEFRDVLRMPGDGQGGPIPRLMDALFTRWTGPAPIPTPMIPA